MEMALGYGLAQMKEVDIHTVDRESMVDIRKVRGDGEMPGGSGLKISCGRSGIRTVTGAGKSW